jgi:hypothetical protein
VRGSERHGSAARVERGIPAPAPGPFLDTGRGRRSAALDAGDHEPALVSAKTISSGLSITAKSALLPPSGLTYAVNPALYTVGTPIAENTPHSSGGAVESYSVFPSLPAGLSTPRSTAIPIWRPS